MSKLAFMAFYSAEKMRFFLFFLRSSVDQTRPESWKVNPHLRSRHIPPAYLTPVLDPVHSRTDCCWLDMRESLRTVSRSRPEDKNRIEGTTRFTWKTPGWRKGGVHSHLRPANKHRQKGTGWDGMGRDATARPR